MNSIYWRGAAMTVALLACCATTVVATAATYDEAILGDLSGTAAVPTPWVLEAGGNSLVGTAGSNHVAGTADFDLVAIEVPAGHQLDSITLVSYVNPDVFAMSFIGLQAGSPWLDGFGFDIAGYSLMGWTHIQTPMAGVDLLPLIQSHANPPEFTLPLPSGIYTMLLEDVDTTISYSLLYNVSAVPEPGSIALLATACMGAATLCRRRRAQAFYWLTRQFAATGAARFTQRTIAAAEFSRNRCCNRRTSGRPILANGCRGRENARML